MKSEIAKLAEKNGLRPIIISDSIEGNTDVIAQNYSDLIRNILVSKMMTSS